MLAGVPGALVTSGSARGLSRAGERALLRLAGEFVWVTHFDHLSVPFYQAFDEGDESLAVNADLILGPGEVVGAGQRHRTGEQVRKALALHEVPEQEYGWYVRMKDVFPMQTSGFGLGMERFLMWVLGHGDIRDIPLVSRIAEPPDASAAEITDDASRSHSERGIARLISSSARDGVGNALRPAAPNDSSSCCRTAVSCFRSPFGFWFFHVITASPPTTLRNIRTIAAVAICLKLLAQRRQAYVCFPPQSSLCATIPRAAAESGPCRTTSSTVALGLRCMRGAVAFPGWATINQGVPEAPRRRSNTCATSKVPTSYRC